MQHHAMAGDPSVFVNLGHTYLEVGGDDARKAVALYERAKKMRPNELKIRLYLAKAHFKLKEFEKCNAVLGDATQIWPDDLLLRYNLAIGLENFGVNLVAEEKRTKRVVGMDNGVTQMNHAVQLLTSAARLFDYVHVQWTTGLTEAERKQVLESSGSLSLLSDEELQSASAHKLYCHDIRAKAQDELEVLKVRKAEIDTKMQATVGQREEEQREKQAMMELQNQAQDKEDEDLERANELQEKAKKPELGQNLEQRFAQLSTYAKPAPRPKKEPKEKPAPRSKRAASDEGTGDGEEGDRSGGKEKKSKKDKKDKKEKKKEKKERKRAQEGQERQEGEKEGEEGAQA